MIHSTRRSTLAVIALLMAALACNTPVEPVPTTQPLITAEAAPAEATAESSDAPTLEEPATEAASRGVRAAFTHDGNVWLWDEGGEPKQITTAGQVITLDLSDDGQVVMFLREPEDAGVEMWAINSNGSDEHLLLSAEEMDALKADPASREVRPGGFAWVPDTHAIAYSLYDDFGSPDALFHRDLRLVNADTGEKSVLLDEGHSGDTFLYSPDGTQIALITPTSISLINADGSNRRNDVHTYAGTTVRGLDYLPSPQWTPDSRLLRVLIPTTDADSEVPEGSSKQIWEIPADGSAARQIHTLENANLSPMLSPDSEWVAWSAYLEGPITEHDKLHISRVDGSQDSTFEGEGAISFYNWAPDSQHFAFVIGEPPALLGRVGQPPVPLSDMDVLQYYPTWIDGTRFFIYARNGDNIELRIGTAGGSSTLIMRITEYIGRSSIDVVP
jgi:hypothetical protein